METPHLKAHKALLAQLRRALAHLDDPAYLETLPFVDSLGALASDSDLSKGQALRRVLRLAIDSLNPNASTGQHPNNVSARTYEVLYRYAVSRQSMFAIATDLGIGERHAYRELQRAISALAHVLSNLLPDYPNTSSDTELAAAQHAAHVRQELERLSRSAEQEVDLTALVAQVVEGLQPLAAQQGSHIHVTVSAPALQVTAQRVMLRQALMNLISAAVTGPGAIHVALEHRGSHAQLQITGNPAPALDRQDASTPYAVAVQLFASLGIPVQERCTAIMTDLRLNIPLTRHRTVLIVDDNEDLIALFRRFLQHQPYAVHGVTSLSQALQALATLQPDVIILDIMMPQQDGWEVLEALRHRQEAAAVPIVICSVINNPQLAAAMGAAAFLNKPVTRAKLLQVLDTLFRPAS
ncbi:MAG: ATP-binding response regulator [Anaerolineae bacterium]